MAQNKPRIAIIVGSTRRDSINRQLAKALAKLGGDRLDFTFVEIGDLPLYNQDLENDLPAPVARVKAQIEADVRRAERLFARISV